MLRAPVMLPERSGKQQQQQLSQKVSARMVSRDTKNSAPSQACNAKTARSISPEQVKHVGNGSGKALAHEKVKFHR